MLQGQWRSQEESLSALCASPPRSYHHAAASHPPCKQDYGRLHSDLFQQAHLQAVLETDGQGGQGAGRLFLGAFSQQRLPVIFLPAESSPPVSAGKTDSPGLGLASVPGWAKCASLLVLTLQNKKRFPSAPYQGSPLPAVQSYLLCWADEHTCPQLLRRRETGSPSGLVHIGHCRPPQWKVPDTSPANGPGGV